MPLFYEDFDVGRQFVSASRIVTEADVLAFADLSGDRNPIHVDAVAARVAGFDGPVAHGVLGLAVATGLARGLELTQGSLIALLGVTWHFRAPVYPGDELVLHLEVASRRPSSRAGRGVVTLAARTRNQRNEVVQEGEFVELVRSRSAALTPDV
jgi:acyl dehydratase